MDYFFVGLRLIDKRHHHRDIPEQASGTPPQGLTD